jgi:hypothetical protein
MEASQQSTAVKSKGRSSSQSPRPKRSRPVDPLDALGLNGFARALGVAPDSVLAVTATLLSGIAGPDVWLQSPWGENRLSKIDLLTTKEDFNLHRLIEVMSAPLSLMNRRLAENMGRLSPDAIDLVTSGPFASAAASKHADANMRDQAIRRHLDALTPTTRPGESGLLRQDLAFDPLIHRRESLQHPQFLLKGVDGRSLNPLVEDCHLRTALVVQPALGLAREGSEPSRVIKLLFALLDGAVVKKRTGPLDRGRDSSLPVKAHALLSLTKDEIDVLASMGAGHLNRFLWVAESAGQSGKNGDADSSEAFLSAFQEAAMEILELRREGRGLRVSFESKAGSKKFEDELHRYEAEIVQAAADVGAWARGLPQSIFWALDFLRRSSVSDHRINDEGLIVAAFSAARRLLTGHRKQVLLISSAQQLDERRALAERIVENVSRAASPMSFRDIVRCFQNQKKDRFTRVIEALIELGVLIRNEDGGHVPGPVDLAEVAEILDEKFILP